MKKIKTYKSIVNLQNKNFGQVYTKEYGVLGVSELDRYYRDSSAYKYQLVFDDEYRLAELRRMVK